MDHSFVIPAYGTAPQLDSLIVSLKSQTIGSSQIVLTTSTPSKALFALAERHALPFVVNPRRIDIATDWNFALGTVATPLVTIAHQDDIYFPDYVATMQQAFERHPEALIAFCDYVEHTADGSRPLNLNLRIKRALCRRGFGREEAIAHSSDKIRFLALGNPIGCPTVAFNRARVPDFRFPDGFKTNLDWMAWLQLARIEGEFIYVRKTLLSKGVHVLSETTNTIASRAREREDRALFGQFWPRPAAAVLAWVYRLSYRANRVTGVAPRRGGPAPRR
ncbi:MAG: glycosyltransferase family 2 protein [Burkholderiaceae bacterium]